jgi:hypothetical protein
MYKNNKVAMRYYKKQKGNNNINLKIYLRKYWWKNKNLKMKLNKINPKTIGEIKNHILLHILIENRSILNQNQKIK